MKYAENEGFFQVNEFKRRLNDLERDLAAKRSKNNEANSIEKQINALRSE